MANTDWAFGFQPYEKLYPCHYYSIVTAPTLNYFHNDIVGISEDFLLTPKMGYLQELNNDAVPDSLDNLLGSIVALFDENFDPVKYIAATDAGNGTIAGYALVADDPRQLFVAREDFDSNAIEATEASFNADLISVALCAGNTTTGLSRQMIDSTSAANTAALNLKLMGPHPNDTELFADDTPGTSGDEGCRFICRINMHYWNLGTATAGGETA